MADKKMLNSALRALAPIAGRDQGMVGPAGMVLIYSLGDGIVEITATDCGAVRALATYYDPSFPKMDVMVPVKDVLRALATLSGDDLKVTTDVAGGTAKLTLRHAKSRATIDGRSGDLATMVDPAQPGRPLTPPASLAGILYVAAKDQADQVMVALDGSGAIVQSICPPRAAHAGQVVAGAPALVMPALALASALGPRATLSVNKESLVIERQSKDVTFRCEVRGTSGTMPSTRPIPADCAELDARAAVAAIARAAVVAEQDVELQLEPGRIVVTAGGDLSRCTYVVPAQTCVEVSAKVSAACLHQALGHCGERVVFALSAEELTIASGDLVHRLPLSA